MRSSWSFDLSHWNSLPIEFLKGNWKQTKVSSVEKIAIPDSFQDVSFGFLCKLLKDFTFHPIVVNNSYITRQ